MVVDDEDEIPKVVPVKKIEKVIDDDGFEVVQTKSRRGKH